MWLFKGRLYEDTFLKIKIFSVILALYGRNPVLQIRAYKASIIDAKTDPSEPVLANKGLNVADFSYRCHT